MSDDKAPYDAGDPKSVRERASAAKRYAASKRIVLRQIMGSNEGRAWMFEVLSLCHVFQTSFSHQALAMAYAEGERNIGLRLTADIVDACPERYFEMLKEANDE